MLIVLARRNSALGSQTPLWMCSAIWEYSLIDHTSNIVYSQTDGGAIGRVDWINDHQAAFVAYYDFQGSRDSINLLDLSDHSCTTLFPYTDEYYNNVTLLPLGAQRLSFTSSKKDSVYNESITMEYDISSGTFHPIEIQMDESTVLLEGFIYTQFTDSIADHPS